MFLRKLVFHTEKHELQMLNVAFVDSLINRSECINLYQHFHKDTKKLHLQVHTKIAKIYLSFLSICYTCITSRYLIFLSTVVL